MSTPIKKLFDKLPQERKDRIKERSSMLIAEYKNLQEFRKALGLTQKELAENMDISQVNISKLEGREDMHLSTLKKYVEALGCELEISIKVPQRDSVKVIGLIQ